MRVRGFTAPVFHLDAIGQPSGREGIGLAPDGAGLILTMRHEDGTLLGARLDDAALERFAEAVALVVEHGNAILFDAVNDR